MLDSGPLWRAAYHDLAADLGIVLTEAVWSRLVGRTIVDSIVELGVAAGVEGRPGVGGGPSVKGEPGVEGGPGTTGGVDGGAEVARRAAWLVQRAARLAREGDPGDWMPGARDVLHAVQRSGTPTALVTTTWRRVVTPLLAHLDVGFDVTVCGDEVGAGKPAPEPYLRAISALGVAPGDCVAVEDSPTGMRAALAAGARVLLVPSGAPPSIPPRCTRRSSLVGLTLDELACAGTSPD